MKSLFLAAMIAAVGAFALAVEPATTNTPAAPAAGKTAPAPAKQKSKLAGDAYYFHTGEMYDVHAYNHVRTLEKYAKDGEFVPADIVDEQTAEVRHNIEMANKAYAKISDTAKKNPITAKHLAEIQKFHEGIIKLTEQLDDETAATSLQIKQSLNSAYAASRRAAETQNVFTEEWDQPGHGAFSD